MDDNNSHDVKGGHVHFSEDTDEIGHTFINVKVKDSHNYEAHVGFLQVHHKYKIIIKLPVTDAKKGYTIGDKVPSVYAKIMEMKNLPDNKLEITVEFYAYKEKLLKEKLHLMDPDGKEISIIVFARVLGKGKGTPMLREDVTCIGVETTNDESEASDWQGFE